MGFLKQDSEEMEKDRKVKLIADVNGEAIGNLEIHFCPDSPFSHIAEMTTVVVNPRFQRKGIGLRMIETAFQIAKVRSIEIVKIDVESKNTPAINLYNKVGFKEYGRFEHGIKRHSEYDDIILLNKEIGTI